MPVALRLHTGRCWTLFGHKGFTCYLYSRRSRSIWQIMISCLDMALVSWFSDQIYCWHLLTFDRANRKSVTLTSDFTCVSTKSMIRLSSIYRAANFASGDHGRRKFRYSIFNLLPEMISFFRLGCFKSSLLPDTCKLLAAGLNFSW